MLTLLYCLISLEMLTFAVLFDKSHNAYLAVLFEKSHNAVRCIYSFLPAEAV